MIALEKVVSSTNYFRRTVYPLQKNSGPLPSTIQKKLTTTGTRPATAKHTGTDRSFLAMTPNKKVSRTKQQRGITADVKLLPQQQQQKNPRQPSQDSRDILPKATECEGNCGIGFLSTFLAYIKMCILLSCDQRKPNFQSFYSQCTNDYT